MISAERWKQLAAWLFLILPLFAYPLVWLKCFYKHVPYWDDAVMFGTAAMSLYSAGVLIFAGVSGIRKSCGRSRINIALVAGAVLLWLISTCRVFCFGMAVDPSEWFVILLPLAGMVLSREIFKILPCYGTVLLVILVLFSFLFTTFTGLPGNWNWNLSLLAVFIPAPFIFFFHIKPERMWVILVLPIAFLIVFSLFYPELSPRGAIVGAVGASIAAAVVRKKSRKQRMTILCLCGLAGIAMFLHVWLGPLDSSHRSSRIWLWRGSTTLALKNSFTGVGVTGFERQINPFLPREYYFSEFATERHTHPHNEILAMWCGYGIAGAAFVFLLCIASVNGFSANSSVRIWAFWSVLMLFLHGQFDVLLETPIAGVLFWGVAGALVAVPVRKWSPGRFTLVIGGVAMIVALLFAVLTFKSGILARKSRMYSAVGEHEQARKELYRSLSIFSFPQTRYRAGMVELFDFKNPAAAIPHFESLAPGYVHSNGFLARAHAANGNIKQALYYFEQEQRYYPISALNAFWELQIMRACGIPEKELAERIARLNYLLKIRNLSVERIGELIRNPSLDDKPVKNP